MKKEKKILEVPYYSQFTDIDDKYWMLRACAVASLKMVLDYHKTDSPDLIKLIEIGNDKGGYGPSGWYHDALVDLAKKYGLEAHRKEKMDLNGGLEKVLNCLENDNPVIVSTPKFILDQKRFHMVVLVGFDREGDLLKGFYFHDPEATHMGNGKNLYVSLETFKNEWRKMAIFVSKKT